MAHAGKSTQGTGYEDLAYRKQHADDAWRCAAPSDLMIFDMLWQPPVAVNITEVKLSALSKDSVCF